MSTSPFLHNSFPKNYNLDSSPLKSLLTRVKSANSSPIVNSALPIIHEIALRPTNIKDGEIDSIEEILMTPTEAGLSLLDASTPQQIIDEYKSLNNKELGIFLKNVANILGDGLVTGRGLDGSGSPPQTYKLWQLLITDLIDTIPDKSSDECKILCNIKIGIDQIIEHASGLESLYIDNDYTPKKLHDISLKYANKVHDLKADQSQMFYGGYTEIGSASASGHALIYEFTRRQDKLFDIHVYTSSGLNGVNTYPVGLKRKQETLATYVGVPESVLLFNEDRIVRPGFIQSLNELKVFGLKNPNLKLSIKDVEKVFSYLDEYRVAVDINEKGLITGQIGGTCASSVMKVFIRNNCGNLGLYKQVIHRIKGKLLAIAYNRLKERLKDKDENGLLIRQMFLRVSRNLFRNTKKLLKGDHGFGPLISEESAKQSLATARDVILQVKKVEEQIKISQQQRSQSVNLEHLDTNNQRNCRFNLSVIKQERHETIQYHDYLPVAEFTSPTQNFLQSLRELLERLDEQKPYIELSIISAFPSKNEEVFLFEFTRFIDLIPVPRYMQNNSFWEKLTKEDLREIQRGLFALGLFYKSLVILNDLEPFPRRVLTLTTLQVLSHYIAVKIEEIFQGEASINHYAMGEFYDLLKNDEMLFFDRLEFQRLIDVKEYISSVNKSAKVRDELFFSDGKSEVEKGHIRNANDNGKYWLALIKSKKDDIKEKAISKANVRWKDPNKNTELLDNIKIANELLKKPDGNNLVISKFTILGNRIRIGSFNDESNPIKAINNEVPIIYKLSNLVDLPEDTKLVLLMEECDQDGQNNFLTENQLDHISIYRYFTRFAHAYSYKNLCAMPPRVIGNREYWDSYEISIEGYTKELPDAPEGIDISKLHRPQASLVIVNEHITMRNELEWKKNIAEGEHFRDGNETLSKRIKRTLSQWELSPNQILYELAKDLNELKDPKVQASIIKLFFRSPIIQGERWMLGAGELIRTDQAFFDNAYGFINKSLALVEKLPDGISIARFLFELSFYLSKYLADAEEYEKAEKLNQIGVINRWLNFKQINEDDRLFLHHYITAFYSTKQNLSDGEIAEALASWSAFSLVNKVNSEILSPTINRYAKRFILMQRSAISKKIGDPEFRKIAGNCILSTTKLTDKPIENWEIFRGHYISSGEWKINLFTGDIYKADKQLKGVPKNSYWINDPFFLRLFKNHASFTYRMFGDDEITFMENGNRYYRRLENKRIIIEKEFPLYARKMELFSISSSEYSGVPNHLIYDHAFWMTPVFDLLGKYFVKGVFTDLIHKKITHVMLADGTILDAQDSTSLEVIPKNTGSALEYLNFSTHGSALLEFDSKENIAIYRNRLNDKLEKILFSRYKTMGGNMLTFINDEQGELAWSENWDFIIPKVMKKSCFNFFKKYLHLESRKGDRGMILIPFGEFKRKSMNHSEIEFVSDQSKPIIEYVTSNELIGNQIYFTYEENKGNLKPTSTESTLYLALIQLVEMNAEEAFRLLKSQNSNEILSPVSLKILEMILNLLIKEDYPNFIQVKLYSLNILLLQNEMTSREEPKKENKYAKQGINCFTKVYDTQNNISVECRLTVEEELRIIKYLDENLAEDMNDIGREFYLYQKELLKERYEFLSTKQVVPISSKGIIKFTPLEQNLWGAVPNNYNLNNSKQVDLIKLFESKEIDYFPNILPLTFSNDKGRIYSYPSMKLFFDIYRIAKSGSLSERRFMIYKMSLWKSNEQSIKTHVDCLIALLFNPDRFSKLPSKFTTSEEIVNFVNNFEVEYATRSHIFTNKKDKPNVSTKPVEGGHYPYLNRDPEPLQITLNDIQSEAIPLNVALDPQNVRWDKLNNWKKNWIKDSPKIDPLEKNEKSTFRFEFNEKLLKNKEKGYTESLKKDMEEFQKDYEEGERQNLNARQYNIDNGDCQKLIKDTETEIASVQVKKSDKEVQILSLANRMSGNQVDRLVEIAEAGGQQSSLVTMQDCIDALLSNDGRSYQLKNKNLTDPALVKEISDLTLEYLDLKSYVAQLERTLDTAKQINAIDVSKPDEQVEAAPTRRYLCQNLQSHLDGKYHFDEFLIEEQVILRTFAGQSGILPYKKQTDLIKKMLQMSKDDPTRFNDIVIQLIMGGGKTSVIATILLYMASRRKGRLALFIVPGALMETVYANLGKSMKIAFGKDLLQLNLQREDFTTYRLDKTQYLLSKCININIPMLVNAVTIQGFELEMLSIARKIKTNIFELAKLEKQVKSNEKLLPSINQLKAINQELIKKGRLLAEILTLIGEKGDALMDEVDLILDSHQELNYVDGIKVHVESAFNELLHSIYKGLVSEKINVESPNGKFSIREYVKLHTNQQSLLSNADYLNYVTPTIAQYLAEKFKPIASNIGHHKDAFIRYASGQMPDVLQKFEDENLPFAQSEYDKYSDLKNYKTIEDDIRFLKYLKTLSSGSKKEALTGNLISLSKHYLQELVQSTLNQTGGRNYGLSPNPETPGKIIPYLGLHTPTNREYGYHWEAAAYQYQFGVSTKPTKDQILLLAEKYEATAAHYIATYGEKYESTAEYEEFHEKFGVKLDELKEPGQIDKAISYISQNYKRLLEFQFELVTMYATYASERLTSNGLSLCRLLASKRTMSGTPWNYEGYLKSLAENCVSDPGTQGKIFHTMIRRAKEKRIYSIDFHEKSGKQYSVKDFFEQLRAKNNPRFKKIRGIIEAGDLFKHYGSNANIAKDWMQYIQETQDKEKDLLEEKKTINPKIDAVIYFDKDPGQDQPNVVYVWKKGADKPERLGISTYSELKAKGLIPQNYVVYIDGRHCTGSDFLQIPDAVNEFTFDVKMLLRTTSQAVMRLRQFLEEQDVDIILSEESLQAFHNNGKSVEDLLIHSGKVQSIHKTQSMVQYFTQQVQNLFDGHSRMAVLKSMLGEKFDLEFANLVQSHEQFFVRKMHEAPQEQHGRLDAQTNTKKSLLNLLDHTNIKYKKTIQDQKIQDSVDKEIAVLKEWIETATCMPEETAKLPSKIGIHQENHQQIQQQQQNQMQLSIEKQIEMELKNYQAKGNEKIRVENPLSDSSFIAIIKYFINGDVDTQPDSQIFKLQEHLEKFNIENPDLKAPPFQTIFKERIYGTLPYFHTTESYKTMSIFDSKHRPAKQILAIRDVKGRMNWLCLSEFEAGNIKGHLQTLYGYLHNYPFLANVWLIQPDGTNLFKHPAQEILDIEDEVILKGLLEVNALAGNIDFIDHPKNESVVEPWLLSNTELKLKFLKLRTYNNSSQQNRLKNSQIISRILNDSNSHLAPNILVCKKRTIREANRLGNFRPNSAWETKLLKNPIKLRDLSVENVQYLGLDWNLRNSDPNTKMAYDKLRETTKDEVQLKAAAEEITKDQFKYICSFHGGHLLPHQMVWLPKEKVNLIKHPHQIMSKDGDKTHYHLSKKHVKRLAEHQANLIPYINPEFISLLEHGWQITVVPREHIKKIKLEHAHIFSKEQLKHAVTLDKEYVAKLAEKLSSEQIIELSLEEILLLPEKYRRHIEERHVRDVRNPETIKILETLGINLPGMPTSWVDPSMVEHVPDNFVRYLKHQNQIDHLKDRQIEFVGPGQVGRLSTHQLLIYKQKNLSNWDELSKSINGDQIAKMTPEEKFNLLPLSRFLENLDAACVRLLKDSDHIKRCPNGFVEDLGVDQVPHISSTQARYLKGASQVNACPIKFIVGIADSEVKHLTKETIEQLKLAQILRFLNVAGFNKKFIPTRYIIELNDPAMVAEVDEKVIEGIDFNKLDNNHALWGRITKENIKDLSIEKIHKISKKQFKHLEKAETLKKIGFFDVVHLSKEQITKRRDCKLAYFLGVMTLGVAMAVISLFGYIFIPCTMCSQRNSKSYRKWLNQNFRRFGHLFNTYLAAPAA